VRVEFLTLDEVLSLHADPAAYLFHLVKNHPFVDGNKRTALVAMLAFLGLNGRRLEAPDDDLIELVLGVVEGRITKAEIAVFVQRHGVPRGIGRRRKRRGRPRSP